MMLIQNANLIQAGVIQAVDVVIKGERIEGIYPAKTIEATPDMEVISAEGLYLSHGFIDTHVHGGGGYDYMDGTKEAWFGIGELHVQHGTTDIVPTTLSSDSDELLAAIKVYEQIKHEEHRGPRILGLHLEGPYLSPEQSGAQDPTRLKDPDSEEYQRILAASEDILKWTIAPELPGALEMGMVLQNHAVLPCIGHSNATIQEVRKALTYGYRSVTHLYSGCSTISRKKGFRYPGVVEAAYLLDGLSSELISDGCHLPADLLEMAYRFIGSERLVLVTDGMRAAGQTEGESILGSLSQGQRVIIEDDVAKMPDREAFAGSVATMDRLVRTMYQLTSASLAEVIQMVTETPAKVLGLQNQTGTVAKGRLADLVLFDETIDVKHVLVGGKTCYTKLNA